MGDFHVLIYGSDIAIVGLDVSMGDTEHSATATLRRLASRGNSWVAWQDLQADLL